MKELRPRLWRKGERTGKAPSRLKWIDRNKRDTLKPNYRSRLVVREIKKQHGSLPGHMLFSNMPPSEEAKLLSSMLARKRKSKRGKPLKLALFGISHEHTSTGNPNARSMSHDEEGKCALLLTTMYGTQGASHVWQLGYTALLIEVRARKGLDISVRAPGAGHQVVGTRRRFLCPSRPGGARLHGYLQTSMTSDAMERLVEMNLTTSA